MGQIVNLIQNDEHLREKIKLFDKYFNEITKHYEELMILENEVSKLQKEFDTQLDLYIKSVGKDKVPLEFFDYTLN